MCKSLHINSHYLYKYVRFFSFFCRYVSYYWKVVIRQFLKFSHAKLSKFFSQIDFSAIFFISCHEKMASLSENEEQLMIKYVANNRRRIAKSQIYVFEKVETRDVKLIIMKLKQNCKRRGRRFLILQSHKITENCYKLRLCVVGLEFV